MQSCTRKLSYRGFRGSGKSHPVMSQGCRGGREMVQETDELDQEKSFNF